MSLAWASVGSTPGTVRIDRRKRVCGAIVFEALDTGRASKPITEIDGLVHIRAAMSPDPASCSPSTMPAAARSSSSGQSTSA